MLVSRQTQLQQIRENISGAIRRGMKRGGREITCAVVAVWAGRSANTVHNWTREGDPTTPDAAAFLALCSNAEGPMREELALLAQKHLPELELVGPVAGPADGSATPGEASSGVE